MTREYKKTICPLDCPDRCGIVATVEDGRVVALKGDAAHPYTAGLICRKMRRYPERLYSENRILTPLLRSGKKGEGIFSKISWDDALAICAERLGDIHDSFGGEAILPWCYGGNMGRINRFAGFPFFHRLGTLDLKQTICSRTAGAGWAAHCPEFAGSPPETVVESDLVVVWGMNAKVTNLHFYRDMMVAKRQGAKVVVIDPCRGETAREADCFLQIRQGGDVALALGVAKILSCSGRIDRQFLDRHSRDFELFSASLSSLSFTELERQSGIERGRMEEFADMLARRQKTFLRIGMGMTRNSRGGMAVRAVTSLAALLGLFTGGAGRGVLLGSEGFSFDDSQVKGAHLRREEAPEVNMIHLGLALTRRIPPVRALVVYNANPLSSSPDSSRVRAGLSREDLFTVVHEQVMTPTARYADLLLPATTFLENHDIYSSYGHFYLGVARPVISPLGEAKSNFDFFQLLARRMGFTEEIFSQSCQERIASCLAGTAGIPAGLSPEEVMAGGYIRSARSHIRLADDSGIFFHFAATGEPYPGVARLIAAGEADDPDLESRYPLVLITPPNDKLLNSTFGERYEGQTGTVLVHPEDASRYGVAEGMQVWLESSRGRAPRIVKVSEDTRPGLVVAPGVFWAAHAGAESGREWGINDVTSQKVSDMAGGATFHESRVRLVMLRDGDTQGC